MKNSKNFTIRGRQLLRKGDGPRFPNDVRKKIAQCAAQIPELGNETRSEREHALQSLVLLNVFRRAQVPGILLAMCDALEHDAEKR